MSKITPKTRILGIIGLVTAIAFTVLVARATTEALIGSTAPEETAQDAKTSAGSVETDVAPSTTTTAEADRPVDAGVGANEDQPSADDSSDEAVEAETRLLIGDPIILGRSTEAVPDTVSIEPGVVFNLEPYLTAKRSTGTLAGPGDGGDAEPDILDAPLLVEPVLGASQQPLNVGLWVEPETSHLALITLGVNPGPEGLADLTVELGDGNTLTLDDQQLGSLKDGGVVEIVHRYEPTLTPQRQSVKATATDNAGASREDSQSFATRAEFLARFSPLEVTSLGDCDLFGKGDFVLSWNIDGRPRESEFKLGDGETYVEENFSVGISGLTYGGDRSFSVQIAESDSLGVEILKFAAFPVFAEFSGGPSPRLLDVLQFGTHIVPVSITRDIVLNNCKAQLDFTVTLAVDERTDI